MFICVSTAQARTKRATQNSGLAFFLQISIQNGASEMSMCVSNAQARTKRAPRNSGPAFSCKFPYKMALSGLGSGIFPGNYHASCGIGVPYFSGKFPDKMALVTCPCAFRLHGLAQSVFPGLEIGFPPLCSHMCALICVLSNVLSYLCFHLCALICVVSYVCSYMCVLIRVLSSVCSPLCSHVCALMLCPCPNSKHNTVWVFCRDNLMQP